MIIAKFETDYFEENIILSYPNVIKAIQEFLNSIEIQPESTNNKN